MQTLEVHQIAVLRDNYVYLARDVGTGACAAIDPAEAPPVLEELRRLGWRLTHVFNTHHHPDHTGGNLELKRATGCTIVGNAADAKRIPGIDVLIREGDEVALGAQRARVIEVSGHTIGHIAYWFAEAGALFCGDTLFSLGCGRLFEGTAAEMWRSLAKLRALPDDTLVYCAHEYTQSNGAFAVTVDPGNAALRRRLEQVRALRAAGKSTVPSTMGEERAANPFLRADDATLQRAVGLPGESASVVFAEIRRRKDVF
jgi:hydroxyacylglutathione hydrolase